MTADASTRRSRLRPARLAIAVVIVGFSVMWIYAWFFAPRGNADRFDDPVWSAQAEQTCAATATQIEALPSAVSFKDVEPKAQALLQRAGVLDQATRLLERQVATLRQTPPTEAKARVGVGVWLADWDGYLVSRQAQAARLRAGQDQPFAVAEQGGAPVTLRMDAFAKANSMPSCIVPDDIG